MICSTCGKEMKDDTKFCPACGAQQEQKEQPAQQPQQPAQKPRKRKPTVAVMVREGKQVTPNIVLCEDGKYRWTHQINLLKNPVFFLMVWRILFFIVFGIFVFFMVMNLMENGFEQETLFFVLKLGGYFLGGMTVLCLIGYLLYAAFMGGKYVVMFEMNEESVTHKQLPRQAKKAQGIAEAAMIVGALAGARGTYSAGLAGSRTEMTTEFARVRRVKVFPRRGLIKVNQLLSKNQVYAAPEDFEFVRDYILQHVPEKARPKQFRENNKE